MNKINTKFLKKLIILLSAVAGVYMIFFGYPSYIRTSKVRVKNVYANSDMTRVKEYKVKICDSNYDGSKINGEPYSSTFEVTVVDGVVRIIHNTSEAFNCAFTAVDTQIVNDGKRILIYEKEYIPWFDFMACTCNAEIEISLTGLKGNEYIIEFNPDSPFASNYASGTFRLNSFN